MNAGWGGGWPNTASNAVANIQNRQAPFQLLGSSTIVAPTPFTSKFLAGNHYDVNTGTGGNAVMAWIPAYAPPAASWYTYMEAYEQHDPFWWFCAGPATIVYTGIYTLGQNTFSIQGGIPAFFTTGDGNQLFSLSNTVFTSPQGDPCFITAVDVTNNIVTMNKTALVGGTFGLQSVAYGDRDENCKKFDYTANQSTPYATTKDWYTANNPNAPKSNSAPDSYALGQDLGVPANPDNNGHSSSWGASNNPTNPAKGWNGWFKVFYAAKWSTGTDGFWQYGEIAPNGVSRLIVNYSGPTLYSGLTSWGESIGGYARNQGAMGLNPFLSSPASGAGVSGTFTQWRYYANAYYDRNPTTLARFYLTNSSTFTIGDGNPAEIQPYTSWATGLVTVKINQGNLANGAGSLWYVDEANSVAPTLVTSVSLVAAPAVPAFDWFISNTGNDANPGTLSQPWAITSFTRTNTNNAKMAGKRVGLIQGIYAINSMWVTKDATGQGYEDPALNVPAGTTANPTYIASCNASGVYTPLAAQITASPSGTPGGGNPTGANNSTSIMGQYFNATQGNFTLDGLAISDTQGYLVAVFVNTGTPTGGTVQNCHLYNVGGSEGNNPGAVMWSGAANGFVCRNNKVHDGFVTGAGNHNMAAFFTLGNNGKNHQYLNNTVYNFTSTVYHKNGLNGGHTHAYNYYDNTGGTNPEGVFVNSGSAYIAPGLTLTLHHNIMLSTASNIVVAGHHESTTPADVQGESLVAYNNLMVTRTVASPGNPQSGYQWQTTGTGSPTTMTSSRWNDIYIGLAGNANGGLGAFAFGSAAGALGVNDYNCYAGVTGGPSFSITNNAVNGTPTYSSLAAVRAGTGLETHSIAQLASTGLFVNPDHAQLATGYQLVPGSAFSGKGSTNGLSSGTPCDPGPYGYDQNTGINNAQVGCNFS